jgi:hypothetical protein
MGRDAVAQRSAHTPEGDALGEVTREALAKAVEPVVQSALTGEVLKALDDLIKLTPQVVAAIEQDLESDNEFLRQHAYQTLLKYTVGHKGLVPDVKSDTAPITVIIDGVERPPETAFHKPPEHATDGREWKQCDRCGEVKPVDQFAANSTRCVQCYELMRSSAIASLSDAG